MNPVRREGIATSYSSLYISHELIFAQPYLSYLYQVHGQLRDNP